MLRNCSAGASCCPLHLYSRCPSGFICCRELQSALGLSSCCREHVLHGSWVVSSFWEMEPDCGVVPVMVNGKLKYINWNAYGVMKICSFSIFFSSFPHLTPPPPFFFPYSPIFPLGKHFILMKKMSTITFNHHFHAKAVCVSGPWTAECTFSEMSRGVMGTSLSLGLDVFQDHLSHNPTASPRPENINILRPVSTALVRLLGTKSQEK